ncbi:hypothetical protein [Haloquadratum walsbyi]|uniref:Uncharacterized protein n=1 Tax=Haloquadratum walsbyi J07HQW2 TaxID=1238425 RepID=U1MUX7_9EURY|nr:hypothetical protein [Haloquadratum walsbyi]ERG94194.1 MAG: hypothetical protein J07HQW2_00628 [Haloquadratum walsbyi J07HQW2]
MSKETPPDVANLQGKEDVDWLVARRRKLGIADRDVDGTVDRDNYDGDTPDNETESDTDDADVEADDDTDTDADE